jgi:hypothetical protein
MFFVAGLCQDLGGLDEVLKEGEVVNNWEALRLYLEVVEDLFDLFENFLYFFFGLFPVLDIAVANLGIANGLVVVRNNLHQDLVRVILKVLEDVLSLVLRDFRLLHLSLLEDCKPK